MAYYSEGAFSFGDLYEMPIQLRRFYMDKLVEAKEEEKKRMDKATKKRTR
jgi:hypothetical protein|tara:strand:- start:673 stop:822 length:150 start_codon:yes stop_codon:yes gene_type:complete